ncbi:inositol 1,4,5-trisphosphate receptor-interacting protein-like 1 [Sylvia atricapilla]|uniref:inositol 1,4,5-trisphosphate receptor-interacting protein-like 1 n=1 Tax=Sylvia atricapilla TaxID=48155 RepID=UPI0033945557
MKSVAFLFVLVKALSQYLQPVGDVWDEETRLRMEARAKRLEWERIRLEQEVEQLSLKQVQVWQPVAVTVLLLLLLVLWFIGWKSSLRREELEEENSGANGEEVPNADANEGDDGGNEEADASRQEDSNVQEAGQGAANEGGSVPADEGGDAEDEEEAGDAALNEEDDIVNEVINEIANEIANNNDEASLVQGEDNDFDDHVGRILMERIQWPVQDLQKGCEWTTELMDNYIACFAHVLSDSFYPVLPRAIGVGSAFEGWSPREQDVVYRVLIPMTPPRGHSFHLELDSAGQRHVRNFRVRVQLECTCSREQQADKMLCFLHHPEEELRSNQDPSLLDTLCTDSYLDVHKTARWLYQVVRAVWPALPQSHSWHLKLLPSRRSCQIQVTNGTESFRIEMLLGVQRDDSHIFVSSQPREAYTPSTTWPETYAVAETEFFKHIARQAPPDSLHLKCLQFFTRLQLGFGFSTYTTKTIVMHLLNVEPVSSWRRRDLLLRLVDISESLRLCVQAKRLNHFVVGNWRLPEDITLPRDVQMDKRNNLFHHLAQQSTAHTQAIGEYQVLRKWFKRVLLGQR